MTKRLTVTLKINEMSKQMRAFDFVCGESNCYDSATMEFEIRSLDDLYQMPLCARHARRLAVDAGINSV